MFFQCSYYVCRYEKAQRGVETENVTVKTPKP
jgi:hypothetical protein